MFNFLSTCVNTGFKTVCVVGGAGCAFAYLTKPKEELLVRELVRANYAQLEEIKRLQKPKDNIFRNPNSSGGEQFFNFGNQQSNDEDPSTLINEILDIEHKDWVLFKTATITPKNNKQNKPEIVVGAFNNWIPLEKLNTRNTYS